MADPAERATRIHLARSLPRLLATPLALGVVGVAAVAVGLLVAGGTLGLILAGLGAVLVVAAVAVAILLLSVHLEVEEAAVRLVWLGGHRRYPLVPGPVTRVPLRGPRASKLRPRLGALGWGIGSARLRDEEDIELIRLAPTPSAILIPTERGRVAIAAAREEELLEALARAAQARQRQELVEAPTAPAREPEPEPEPEPPPAPDAGLDLDMEPTSLTGIERALLEERLARERAEAMRAAEEARTAAAVTEAASASEATSAEIEAPSRESAPPTEQARVGAPAPRHLGACAGADHRRRRDLVDQPGGWRAAAGGDRRGPPDLSRACAGRSGDVDRRDHGAGMVAASRGPRGGRRPGRIGADRSLAGRLN